MTPELIERLQAARLYRDDPVNHDDHRFQWAVRVDEIQSERIEALEAAIAQAREALERIEWLSTNHGGWFDQDQFGEYVKLGGIARQALSALDKQ